MGSVYITTLGSLPPKVEHSVVIRDTTWWGSNTEELSFVLNAFFNVSTQRSHWRENKRFLEWYYNGTPFSSWDRTSVAFLGRVDLWAMAWAFPNIILYAQIKNVFMESLFDVWKDKNKPDKNGLICELRQSRPYIIAWGVPSCPSLEQILYAWGRWPGDWSWRDFKKGRIMLDEIWMNTLYTLFVSEVFHTILFNS